MWVATEGEPYPLRLDAGADGALDFTEYGATLNLTAPPALGSAGGADQHEDDGDPDRDEGEPEGGGVTAHRLLPGEDIGARGSLRAAAAWASADGGQS